MAGVQGDGGGIGDLQIQGAAIPVGIAAQKQGHAVVEDAADGPAVDDIHRVEHPVLDGILKPGRAFCQAGLQQGRLKHHHEPLGREGLNICDVLSDGLAKFFISTWRVAGMFHECASFRRGKNTLSL